MLTIVPALYTMIVEIVVGAWENTEFWGRVFYVGLLFVLFLALIEQVRQAWRD